MMSVLIVSKLTISAFAISAFAISVLGHWRHNNGYDKNWLEQSKAVPYTPRVDGSSVEIVVESVTYSYSTLKYYFYEIS